MNGCISLWGMIYSKFFFTKIIGIGIEAGTDGSFGIITVKKEGKVAILEQEVNENAEKLNLEGK